MERLLRHWHASGVLVDNRMIISVKNEDVDRLNAGAREMLRGARLITGPEYLVSPGGGKQKGYSFCKGDKIIFKLTYKEISVKNGDTGIITSASKDKFEVRLKSGEEIAFNPQECHGFKHGYASTVYKAQGASVEDVYVLHDGFSTMKNSYVAMSRHVGDLRLYVNKENTPNDEQLIKQLSFNYNDGACINYLTQDDLDIQKDGKGVFARIADFCQRENYYPCR